MVSTLYVLDEAVLQLKDRLRPFAHPILRDLEYSPLTFDLLELSTHWWWDHIRMISGFQTYFSVRLRMRVALAKHKLHFVSYAGPRPRTDRSDVYVVVAAVGDDDIPVLRASVAGMRRRLKSRASVRGIVERPASEGGCGSGEKGKISDAHICNDASPVGKITTGMNMI